MPRISVSHRAARTERSSTPSLQDWPTDRGQPRVLVITVAWENPDDVESLLDSLQHLTYPHWDLLVIDNSRTDAVERVARRPLLQTHYHRLPENRGGAGGFNAGMRWGYERDTYRYFWLLDSDTCVDPHSLTALVQAAERQPWMVVGSKICLRDQPEYVQEFGGSFDPRTGSLYLNRHGERCSDVTTDTPVDYLAACSMLVPTEVLQFVGFMDEGLFLNLDDVDWCLRMEALGFSRWAIANSIVYHRLQNSGAKATPPWKYYYMIRNRLFLIERYAPWGWRSRSLFRCLLQTTLMTKSFDAAGRRPAAAACREAVRDFLTGQDGRYQSHGGELDSLPPPSPPPEGAMSILLVTIDESDQQIAALVAALSSRGARVTIVCMFSRAAQLHRTGVTILTYHVTPLSVMRLLWRVWWEQFDFVTCRYESFLYRMLAHLGGGHGVNGTPKQDSSRLRAIVEIAMVGLSVSSSLARAAAGVLTYRRHRPQHTEEQLRSTSPGSMRISRAIARVNRHYDPITRGFHVWPIRGRRPTIACNTLETRLWLLLRSQHECRIPCLHHSNYAFTEQEVVELLHTLVRTLKPDVVVETGTYCGYSTCYLARALENNGKGEIWTFDIEDLPHLWEGDSWAARIHFHRMPSVRMEEVLPDEPVDFAFLDSEHTYATCFAEFTILDPRLRPGGVFALHDTIYFSDLRRVVADLQATGRYEVLTFPTPRRHRIGDTDYCPGLTICRKLK